MDAYQIILGTTLILATILVPGLAVTLAVMPRIGEIRWSERLGLSLVFGLLPYLMLHFLAKNLDVMVTEFTSQAAIIAVTAAGLGIWRLRAAKGSKNPETNVDSDYSADVDAANG